MALHKHVNGIRVELSAEEEAQVRAEWAANDLIREKEQELQDLLSQLPGVEERLKAIEYCLLNKVPSIKDRDKKVKDEHIELLEKCSGLDPLIEAKKLELKAL